MYDIRSQMLSSATNETDSPILHIAIYIHSYDKFCVLVIIGCISHGGQFTNRVTKVVYGPWRGLVKGLVDCLLIAMDKLYSVHLELVSVVADTCSLAKDRKP